MNRFRLGAARASLTVLAALAPALAAAADASTAETTLAAELTRMAPAAESKVVTLATHALTCARAAGVAGDARTLSVIDYSLPSTQHRLWVFDLDRKTLLFEEWVAHGRNTGDNVATHFSNGPGSLMSSLGSFVTEDTYIGHNGYSLRLHGLDAGYNDNADERAIVIHGAPYVSADLIRSHGRLGRSWGCPAVRPDVAHQLIDAIRGGSFVFAYYPDRDWLAHSPLLGDCASARTTAVSTPGADIAATTTPRQHLASR